MDHNCCAHHRNNRLVATKRTSVILPNRDDGNWEEFYSLAALEVDGQKMQERIPNARKALSERSRKVEGNSDHREERDRLEHALHSLKVLATETVAL
jgi:hypothetical protein